MRKPPKCKRNKVLVARRVDRRRKLPGRRRGPTGVPSLKHLCAMALPDGDAGAILELISADQFPMMSGDVVDDLRTKRDDEARDYRFDQRDYVMYYLSPQKVYPSETDIATQFLEWLWSASGCKLIDDALKEKYNKRKFLTDRIRDGVHIMCPNLGEILHILQTCKTILFKHRQEEREQNALLEDWKGFLKSFNFYQHRLFWTLRSPEEKIVARHRTEREYAEYLADLSTVVSSLPRHAKYGDLTKNDNLFPVLYIKYQERYWSWRDLEVNMKFVSKFAMGRNAEILGYVHESRKFFTDLEKYKTNQQA